jgi:hypothetical protein
MADIIFGKKKSKASQTIINNTVNKNYMETLNKNIMNVGVETIINNASSCSSAVNLNNSCDVSKANISGDLNFTSNQTAQGKVNFNCIQENKTASDMTTNMISQMISEMTALNETDAAANLNTAAKSSNKAGFLSPPISSSTSTYLNQTNNITNDTKNIVKNIFETNLKNNFTTNTVNECIGKTNISNTVNLSSVKVEGDANIDCIQTASLEQVQNCKQLSDAINKTTQATFQELGLTVATESDTEISIESIVSTESKNVATGPVEEVGNAVSSIMKAFGIGYMGNLCGSICSGIILLISSLLVIYLIYKLVSGSSSSPKDTNLNDYSVLGDENVDNPLGTGSDKLGGGMTDIFLSTSM